MIAFLQRFDFLTLALLFGLPPLVTALVRPQLRWLMARAAVLALPFALTERFFYPDYWSPNFLFDLIHHVGFGLEDLLFVSALGAFAAAAYPAVFDRRIVFDGRPRHALAVALVAGAIVAALLLHGAGLSMYASTIATEFALLALLVALRRDLTLPSLAGGGVVTAVYAAICLVYAELLPGVFERVWHTEDLFHRSVAGVPLEELVYGFASGALATAALPTVLGFRYHPASRPPSARRRGRR